MTFYKPHPLFFFFKKKVKTVTHRVMVEWENYLPDSHILSFFSHSQGTWRPGVLDRGGKPRPLVLMRKKPGLGPWAAQARASVKAYKVGQNFLIPKAANNLNAVTQRKGFYLFLSSFVICHTCKSFSPLKSSHLVDIDTYISLCGCLLCLPTPKCELQEDRGSLLFFHCCVSSAWDVTNTQWVL